MFVVLGNGHEDVEVVDSLLDEWLQNLQIQVRGRDNAAVGARLEKLAENLQKEIYECKNE